MPGSWIKLIGGGYDYKKYWAIRHRIYDEKAPKIVKKLYKFIIKYVNERNGADISCGFTEEDNFAEPPHLAHGIKGLVIAGDAIIGKNCFISHQVTIGRSRGGCPTIGNNVYIGPGAKIFGKITIGNNVRIGANCVVFYDVPDNATVVLQKPRIIIKDETYRYSIF